MRIILDNCVNQRFIRFLRDYEVVHARTMGWRDLTNGKLLSAAEEAGFDVLLTVDKGFNKQQNLGGRKICLITLDVPSITLAGLEPFVEALKEVLLRLGAGERIGLSVIVKAGRGEVDFSGEDRDP